MNNFNIQFLISPIVGGLIGYFTNWLAIKMLFRPRNEIHIGKIKIPFTPGVIPKEKERLAKNLGQTVGDHLITEDVLIDAISNSNLSEGIINYIDNFINDACEKDYTVEEILDNIFNEKKDIYVETAEKHILDTIKNSNERINNEINSLLKENIVRLLKEYNVSHVSDSLMKELQIIFDNAINEIFTKEDLTKHITNFYNEKIYMLKLENPKVNQIITIDTIEMIKSFTKKHMHKIPIYIKDLPEKNPTMDKNLKDLIRKLIDENISPLLGIFISSTKVYDSMKSGIIDFFENEEKLFDAEMKINEITDSLLNKNINIYIDKIDDKHIEKLINSISQYISDFDKEKISEVALSFASNNIDKYKDMDFYSLMLKINPNFYEFLENIIDKSSKKMTKEIIIKLEEEIPMAKDKILKYKIKDIMDKIGVENISYMKEKILKYSEKIIATSSSFIAHKIDIPKIVEDQINAFEVEEAEKIILDVIAKELNVITVLGGVLGFVIGFVPMIFK